MGTVTNPFGSLLDGLVQGYGLAHQIKSQAMQQEAHQRNMAMQDREMQVQDIQQQMMMQQNGRPVNNGTVQDQLPAAPEVAGQPQMEGGNPQIPILRPVDKSRLIKYKTRDGQELQSELYTPEEQTQRAALRQASANNTVKDAEITADVNRGQTTRNLMLKAQGGGTPASGMSAIGIQDGTPLTRQEFADATQKAAQIRKEGLITTKPDETVSSLNPDGSVKTLVEGGSPATDWGDYLRRAAKNAGKSANPNSPNGLTVPEVDELRSQFTGEAKNPTESSLALKAAKGDKLAEAALKRLDESKRASRPVNQFITPQNLPQGPTTIDQVPENVRGTVKAITEDRMPLPPLSRNNPTNQAIQFWVNKVAPQYSATDFPARNKMMTGFTSGSQSKEIGGINTALGHLGTLGKAIDALNNGDVQVINSIANSIGVQTGKDTATTFKTIVHKVAPEINRAYVGGVGSQGEIKDQEGDFDPKMGSRQLKSNVGMSIHLLHSKLGSLENQWKTTMKSDDFGDRFLMPEAKSVIDQWTPSTPAGGGANPYK